MCFFVEASILDEIALKRVFFEKTPMSCTTWRHSLPTRTRWITRNVILKSMDWARLGCCNNASLTGVERFVDASSGSSIYGSHALPAVARGIHDYASEHALPELRRC